MLDVVEMKPRDQTDSLEHVQRRESQVGLEEEGQDVEAS